MPNLARSTRAALVLACASACTCGSPPAEGPRSVAPAPPAVVKPQAQATITLDVTTDPGGAEIAVDGTTVGKAPVHLVRPRGPALHEVSARLAGYQPGSLRLPFDLDKVLVFSLAQTPKTAAPTPPPATKVAVEAAAAPAPAAPTKAAAPPATAPANADDSYKLDDLKDPYAH